MESLSRLANDLRLLHIQYDVGFSTDDAIAENESRLVTDPFNLTARTALLVHYFRRWHNNQSYATKRLEHILWFIEHLPDSPFCAESIFCVSRSSPDYQAVKTAWLKKIEESDGLLRRANAFMLFAHNYDEKLSDLHRRFFEEHEGSLWAKALNPDLDESTDALDEVIEEELGRPEPSDEIVTRLNEEANDHELVETSCWGQNACSSSQLEELQCSLATNPYNVKNRARVLGFYYNYRTSSWLGFNPDIAAERIRNLTWFIRHAPAASALLSPFLGDPMSSPEFASSTWAHADRFLASLWQKKVAAQEQNSAILENASSFVAVLRRHNVPREVWIELATTIKGSELGKKILQRVIRRWCY